MDAMFNDCRNVLDRNPDVAPGQVWYKPPIDALAKKALAPVRKYFVHVVGWTYTDNSDGSRTVAVLDRNRPVPDAGGDRDNFEIIMKKNGTAILEDSVDANAFAFSAYETGGVTALFFCTYEEISPEWHWAGQNWSP
jgi:hypothetical protein